MDTKSLANDSSAPPATRTAEVAQDASSSRLLSLSAELWNKIFADVAIVVNVHGVSHTFDVKQYHLKQLRLNLALVNKQLRAEVLPIFYGTHLFSFAAILRPAQHGIIKDLISVPRYPSYCPSTTPNPKSPLVCFGFAEPTEDRYPTRTPKHTPNLEDGSEMRNYITLPHYNIRSFIRRLELVLLVPNETEYRRNYGVNSHHRRPAWYVPRYADPKRDWLYPVRNLKELGFTKLAELKLVMKHTPYADLRASGGGKCSKSWIQTWVGEEMGKMGAQSFADRVEMEYQQVLQS